MKSATRNRSTAADAASEVGILLLDSSLKPLYVNADGVQVLTYPRNPQTIESLDRFLARKIHSVVVAGQSSPKGLLPNEYVSRRRRYLCRTFPVESPSGAPSTATVVLLERNPRRSIDVAQIAAEFHLTRREQEAAELISQGLTNRQIAARMNVSPNTVKSFIRYVMVKMGVSNRSGILVKIVRGSRRGE